MKKLSIILVALFTISSFSLQAINPKDHTKAKITEKEVMEAQKVWGEGIVKIGKTFTDGGDYVQAAKDHINTLYAYEMTDVLFKPTKAADDQFRMDYEGALSYFVGKNKDYSEDGGFAINPWTNVRFDNKKTFIHGDIALAMGNYYFTTTSGDDVKVEYSFGYVKDEDGNLRIILHHSSVPFQL